MAINLLLQYPGQVDPATVPYPYGIPRNVTAPLDGTGTPLEKAWFKDDQGFKQHILQAASIVPSGTADDANTSQYLQALKIILLDRDDIAFKFGGVGYDARPPGVKVVIAHNNQLAINEFHGGEMEWVDTAGTVVLLQSQMRSPANNIDLNFFGGSKVAGVTWAKGTAGEGGMAAANFPLASGWYALFAMAHNDYPNELVDFIWDSNGAGANVYADPNVIAAGFPNDGGQWLRRIGWSYYDGAVWPKWVQSRFNPRQTLWDVTKPQSTTIPDRAQRLLYTLPHVPAGCIAHLSVSADLAGGGEILFTTEDQADTPAADGAFHLRGDISGTQRHTISLDILTGTTRNIYARAHTTLPAPSLFSIVCHGWTDPLQRNF